MITNKVVINRRIILSASRMSFFQQKRKGDCDNRYNMKSDPIDYDKSLNEENENYILGYN